MTDLALAEKYASMCADGFFVADDGKKYPEKSIKEQCDTVTEYTVSGELNYEDGRYMLKYTEPEDIGYDGCLTALVFEENDPDTVTLVRTGGVSMACRFDMKEKRQHCCYDTPIMPLEFNINVRSVHNTVSFDGGAMLLDYYIEVRGSNAERNKLFIEVRTAADEDQG